MLSTLNQRKSSVATASARSVTRKTTKSSTSLYMIPNFKSVLSVSIAACMSIALTGCGGGNDPTTRTDTTTGSGSSTSTTTYNLTVQSPVLLHNVKITVIDTATGTLIGQTTVSSGNSGVIAIPATYLKSGNVLMATLSPIDSSSQYFDPMLNSELGAMTTFNQPLHALISMGTTNTTIKVDPFSEIVYQRTLIRTGTVDWTSPLINQLNTSQLATANTELIQALGTVATTPYSVLFNSPTSIAAVNLYIPATKNTAATINYPSSYAVIALGQLALYAENNLSDTTPYLNFAARAALDMRDGDFDGMTTFGGDTAGTVVIANPILYSGVTSLTNDDPDNTSINTLITVNSNQRIQRGAALKQATTQYFSTLNASLPVASQTDSTSLNYIQTYDYAVFNGTYSSYTSSTVNTPAGRVGAGNYTLAFGLPTGTNFLNALDASDASGRSNSIMQLNGVYKASNGCQLLVGYDGTIQLRQGSQVYQAVVNRKFSDSLTRINGNQYLLNVTSSDLTAPQFIQIYTNGAQVVSADTGRSTQQTPTTLDTTDLSCTF
jgi:hypothetical protein